MVRSSIFEIIVLASLVILPALGCVKRETPTREISTTKCKTLIAEFGGIERAEKTHCLNGQWTELQQMPNAEAQEVLAIIGEGFVIDYNYSGRPGPSWLPPNWVLKIHDDKKRELIISSVGDSNTVFVSFPEGKVHRNVDLDKEHNQTVLDLIAKGSNE